jgi:hypothetical protein
LSEQGGFRRYLEQSHLTVDTAEPDYLLAMKRLAAWISKEFHDIEGIRFLLRYMNIKDVASAHMILGKYYPRERCPRMTLYLLEELLGG